MKILGLFFLVAAIGCFIFGMSLNAPNSEERGQWQSYMSMKNERDLAVRKYTSIDPTIIYRPVIAAELKKADQFISDANYKYEKTKEGRENSRNWAWVISGAFAVIGLIVTVSGFSTAQSSPTTT